MIEMRLAGLPAEVWPTPATSMPGPFRDSLMPDLWDLLRDGFSAIAAIADDDDLVHHYLDATAAAYVFDDARCRGVCTVDPIEMASTRVLYLSGANLHSSLRGQGLYRPLILLRMAFGRRWGCEWWATRTVNPLVVDSYRGFDPYPLVSGEERRAVAPELAAVLYARVGVLEAQTDRAFDPNNGVLGRVYPTHPYDSPPAEGSPEVRRYFASHVDHECGDAVLLLGRLDDAIAQVAPLCEEMFGRSFDQLVDDLHAI